MSSIPDLTSHGGSSTPSSRVAVGIVASSRLLREGLSHLLSAEPSLAVVGEADPREVGHIVQRSPDILVVDAAVDGVLNLCRDARRDGGRPWIVLVGGGLDVERDAQALKAGARGILARTASPKDLVATIRSVHSGEICADKYVVARIIGEAANVSAVKEATETLLTERLSKRQREIVRHAAAGLSNREIAVIMKISEATVKAQLTHIFHKLRVRNKMELVARYQPSPTTRAG